MTALRPIARAARRAAIFATAIIAIATTSADAAGSGPGAPPAVDAEEQARLDALEKQLAAALLRGQVPGAAVVLADAGGIRWMAGLGSADPERGRQVTPATPFAAAAISPVLVGLLAARLSALSAAARKEGAPQLPLLDEPVDEAALGLSNPFAAVHRITVATLLEQTAGLEDLAPRELLPAPAAAPLLADALHLRAHPARWAPGERFSPSRAGIAAAAGQLERWSKRPFFALADAELLRPLGMRGSTFHPDLAALDAMAVGHQDGFPLPWAPPLLYPAQGLVTTAEDLGALLRMIVSGGTAQSGPAAGKPLLTPGLLERVRRGRTLGEEIVDAPGLGTRVGAAEGHALAGQEGVYAGGASALIWFPALQRGYAVLLNAASPEALAEISAALRQHLLRGAPAEAAPGDAAGPSPGGADGAPSASAGDPGAAAPRKLEEVSLEPARVQAELARAAGIWRLASVRLEALRFFDELFSFLVLRPGGQSLEVSPWTGPSRRLLPLGRGAFRGPDEPRASLGLIARAGPEELLAPEGSFVRTSAPAAFGRLVLTFAALLALASSLLFALVWIPRALFGALRGAPDLRLRAAPALCAFALLLLLVLLAFSRQPLGARNLTSLLLCALTLVFPALSLAALLECLRGPERLAAPAHARSPAARMVRAHAAACALLSCALSLELVAHGLAGIRTWAL